MFQNSYTTTSLNPFKDILNEISLFEQTLHCENYIRNGASINSGQVKHRVSK